MIEFKDYPDTSTPLDSKNINANFKKTISYLGSITAGDMDNMIQTCDFYAISFTNRPVDINGYVSVRRLNDNYVLQEYTTAVGKKYSRVKNDGDWSSWARFVTSTKTDYASTFTIASSIVQYHPTNKKDFVKFDDGLVVLAITFETKVSFYADGIYVLGVLPPELRPSQNIAINSAQYCGYGSRAYIRNNGEIVFRPLSNSIPINSEISITGTYTV